MRNEELTGIPKWVSHHSAHIVCIRVPIWLFDPTYLQALLSIEDVVNSKLRLLSNGSSVRFSFLRIQDGTTEQVGREATLFSR